MGNVTLKIVQKYESNAEGRRVVRLRITAQRLHRFVALPIEVTPVQFNAKGKRELQNWIKPTHPNAGVYNEMIRVLWDQAVAAVASAGQGATADAVKSLVEGLQASSATVPDSLSVGTTDKTAEEWPSFEAYTKLYLTRRGESATSDTYKNASGAFSKFMRAYRGLGPDQPVPPTPFADMTVLLLKEWREWLYKTYTGNTPWLYHSRVHTLWMEAMDDIPGMDKLFLLDPFKKVSIPKKKTSKKRLYEDEIERLAELDLPWGTPMRRARDLALVMYYAHGMRVGDAIRLRLSNYVIVPFVNEEGQLIEEHRLIYIMGKGKKPKNALLPQLAVDILQPYRAACQEPTDTLFSYLRKRIDRGYTDYRMSKIIISVVALIRENLIKLALLAGIDKKVSAHVFRHSFADFMRRSKVDTMRIKDALGREHISTTQGYMDDLNQSAVDEVRDIFDESARRRALHQQRIQEGQQ